MMFEQTFSYFSHFILYHIPQLASLFIFLLLFQFEKVDLYDHYAACYVPNHVRVLKIRFLPSNFFCTLYILYIENITHILLTITPQIRLIQFNTNDRVFPCKNPE